MALRSYSGNARITTLAGAISAAATSINVADATGYPTGTVGPFVVTLDAGLANEEKVLCVSRTGNTLTVSTGGRGWDDTAAADHDNGAAVAHTFSATDAREANAHVNDTTGDPHGSRPTEAFVSATMMGAVSGAPTLGVVGGGVRHPAWMMDPAATEVVAGGVDIPTGWATIIVDLLWTRIGAEAAGDVVFTVSLDHAADGASLAVTGPNASVTSSTPAADVLKRARPAAIGVTAAGWTSIRVQRRAVDAGDTFTGDIALLGVRITKAS
jgi:hypothetical protein